MISNMQCKRVSLLPVHRVIHFAKKIPLTFLMKWKISSQRFFSVKFTQIFSPLQRSAKETMMLFEWNSTSFSKNIFSLLGSRKNKCQIFFVKSVSNNLSHQSNLNLHRQNHWEIFQIASLQRWNKWNAAHYLRLKWIYFPWS